MTAENEVPAGKFVIDQGPQYSNNSKRYMVCSGCPLKLEDGYRPSKINVRCSDIGIAICNQHLGSRTTLRTADDLVIRVPRDLSIRRRKSEQ